MEEREREKGEREREREREVMREEEGRTSVYRPHAPHTYATACASYATACASYATACAERLPSAFRAGGAVCSQA